MNQLEAFKSIRSFVFDVDGVFTNSQILVTEEGALLRSMSVRDGFAVKNAIREGYPVCIITGGNSEGVVLRLKGLGVRDVFSGVQDKLPVLKSYVEAYDLDMEGILYMGDDLPDYEAMRRVGLPTCPRDAVREIQELSRYISPFDGGHGCVRDVIEKVMRLQGTWPEV
jgi:3-deoxy-D-manno-octulosonate 8-phosphate phosphatase (KDO 8-P phosphatase)